MVKIIPTENYAGTCFYGVCVSATPSNLIKALGEPHFTDNSGDKTSIEWDFETSGGMVFTIYDWKEYDRPANENRDEIYEFHIGGSSREDCENAKEIIEKYLELSK